MMRYIIGFLGIIAIVILIIVLIVRGGGSGNAPGTIDLEDYLTSSSQVRLTSDGPVSADQTHYSVRISVNESEATIDVIKGYEGQITNSKTYLSNSNAYANFMMSLKRAGFTLGDHSDGVRDERGFCPLGSRYIYELYDNGRQVQRLWSTSCGKQGTLKGNSNLIQDLFHRQIPDFTDITSNINVDTAPDFL